MSDCDCENMDGHLCYPCLEKDRDRWRNVADRLAHAGVCYRCCEYGEHLSYSHGNKWHSSLCNWRIAKAQHQQAVRGD